MTTALPFSPHPGVRSGPTPGPQLDTVHVVLLGVGTVGGHLLEQLRSQQETLVRTQGVALSVVGLANSRHVLFDGQGIELRQWRERLRATPHVPTSQAEVKGLLDKLRRFSAPVLVDCTAADGMEALYEEAFRLGIHVVAANKKPLTLPLPSTRRLHALARCYHRAYHYETTVGASLPVIQTVQDLVRTGDTVRLIEGSFSGTLGYLSTEVARGVPLSQAVRAARAKGYTEPHPRDDLAGTRRRAQGAHPRAGAGARGVAGGREGGALRPAGAARGARRGALSRIAGAARRGVRGAHRGAAGGGQGAALPRAH